MLIAAARVAYGFRLAPVWRDVPPRIAGALRGEPRSVTGTVREPAAAAAGRSRAATVVDAVAASQRREEAPAAAATSAATGLRPAARHALARDLPRPAPVPLGQSFRRRTRGRLSATARRRDAGA
jgi:type IV secretion system protein VirB6